MQYSPELIQKFSFFFYFRTSKTVCILCDTSQNIRWSQSGGVWRSNGRTITGIKQNYSPTAVRFIWSSWSSPSRACACCTWTWSRLLEKEIDLERGLEKDLESGSKSVFFSHKIFVWRLRFYPLFPRKNKFGNRRGRKSGNRYGCRHRSLSGTKLKCQHGNRYGNQYGKRYKFQCGKIFR